MSSRELGRASQRLAFFGDAAEASPLLKLPKWAVGRSPDGTCLGSGGAGTD